MARALHWLLGFCSKPPSKAWGLEIWALGALGTLPIWEGQTGAKGRFQFFIDVTVRPGTGSLPSVRACSLASAPGGRRGRKIRGAGLRGCPHRPHFSAQTESSPHRGQLARRSPGTGGWHTLESGRSPRPAGRHRRSRGRQSPPGKVGTGRSVTRMWLRRVKGSWWQPDALSGTMFPVWMPIKACGRQRERRPGRRTVGTYCPAMDLDPEGAGLVGEAPEWENP